MSNSKNPKGHPTDHAYIEDAVESDMCGVCGWCVPTAAPLGAADLRAKIAEAFFQSFEATDAERILGMVDEYAALSSVPVAPDIKGSSASGRYCSDCGWKLSDYDWCNVCQAPSLPRGEGEK